MSNLIHLRRASQADDYICPCGNTPGSGGFDTCGVNGSRIEPLIGSGWAGHYRCNDCGRISLILDDEEMK
jgi:hypothetical protein|tara:strand:+ start:515 stop:724 length:210 start_codon:yes stop_codon:yes gene_type:complete